MIVDQNGVSFRPSPIQQLLRHASVKAVLSDAQPSKLQELFRIGELRKSCGVDPGMITFRRYLPY
jgi:hypothetical protein